MISFGQESKEEYCMKCIYGNHHKLTYVVPKLDDFGHIIESEAPTIIKKVIKPKKIKGRCERCMKY